MAELVVLDTSVLIDHERGNPLASGYISELVRRNAAALHPVTRGELVFGARDRAHLARIQVMLAPFRSVAVRNIDFAGALALLERHVLSHRIGWPDCLIAATCQRLGAPLVTLNARDFRPIKGLKILAGY